MPDFRAPAHVIGLLVAALGLAMLAPMLADLWAGDGNWLAFAGAAFVTVFVGGATAFASRGSTRDGFTIQQTFLLTVFVWVALPIFGALPFVLGAPNARYVDAFFEAMSGLTTTGSTVFSGLERMPRGVLLWRGLMQWFGGVGIVVVAMAFLPALKVGGMQIFRSEGFDTFGKILPRAGEIAISISWIYVGLTMACIVAYSAAGMGQFDATVHAMTTVATGGFANHDASIGFFGPAVEYAAVAFMLMASLPFVRFVQLAQGRAGPLIKDPQVRAFLAVVVVFALTITAARLALAPAEGLIGFEARFRKALFNSVSVITGTGYASADYNAWGPFAIGAFFLAGLVGGCAGSTSCSIKIFRYQIVFAAIAVQIRRIHSPHGVFTPRWAGRPVPEEVVSSVMAFFYLFLLTLALAATTLSLMGHDALTAVSGAATALANVGPGLGPIIGPASNFASLSDGAKWLLALVMLVGRLELMAVYVLLTGAFWRG
ncbi:MAG: TrkH family potassium uptake protein [Pseudomonadota bacterium]